MTEEYFHTLPINELFKRLAKCNNELFAMERNKEQKSVIKTKQKEIEIIQRVLIAKGGKVSLR
jgi:hypothetical protein